MCTLMIRLARLSAAEEFLTFFSIPFDQRLVDVNRLHILKRFGTSLAALDLTGKEDGAAMAEARATLVEAYRAFETMDARTAGLFKVFQDAAPPAGAAGHGHAPGHTCSGGCASGAASASAAPVRAFVPLSDLVR